MIPRKVVFAALGLLFCFPVTAVASAAAQTAAPAAPQASVLPLQALSGEFTDSDDPDTPFSFYAQDGKLVVESSRMVPTTLDAVSAARFEDPDSKATFSFTLGASGQASAVAVSYMPGAVFQRTGNPVHHVFHDYVRTEAMIPMRDGVKLHAVILKPSDIATPLPFLMQRTPYGCEGTTRASFSFQWPQLARDGYIYVCEDIRGRYKSEGRFVMMRPLADHSDPKAIDESTDTNDTVSWLLKNVPGNNGRVGVVGTSYPGFLAMMAGIDPNPAVKAISPQAPMIDVWKGDDFFHNGAFRQSYGYDYVKMMETSKESSTVTYGKNEDGYNFFLERGSFQEDVKKSGSKELPTWKLFLEHPAYDSVWSSRAVEDHLNKVAVPTLTVGGYYDQEDMYGPQEEYDKLEPHDTDHDNFLVLGPWRHGYWVSNSRRLGNVHYGEPIGKEFRSSIEAKFFGHYLKDETGFDLADTASFQTGSNTWKYYKHFPPIASEPTSLYLLPDGQMGWNSTTTDVNTTYVSDPANPVPYRHRPIQPTYGPGSQWYNWLTEDQRFVTGRKDVAVFRLPVLKKDLVATGDVIADVYASTTGTDNDMVVKLIDQYPDNDPDPKMRGYQLMTNAEIFRGRYLRGFDRPEPLRANSIHEYRFSLHDIDHVFKAGHTVVVEIQSTWFPLYDRNPQTFVPNIMTAKPGDYKPATITIYSDADHQSNVLLPLMNPCDQIACF